MGGGLFSSADATLERNVVRGNVVYATSRPWNGGGGMYMCCGSSSTLTNNVIADNRALSGLGSGLVIRESTSHLAHTTLARNGSPGSSGVYVFDSGDGRVSTVTMTNTVLVGHTIGISVTAGNTATLQATL
jgi:hypothetical protein